MAEKIRHTELRVPPQNLDAERALIGSIMLKPEALHDIVDIVSPEAMYAEKHRLIMKAVFELFSKSEPIDLLTVSGKLKDQGVLEQVGGNAYLAELVNVVPSAANAKHYAEIVQTKYMMRSLISAADEISSMSYDETADIENLLDTAEKRIYEVTNAPTLHKFISIAESLGEAWERIDALHNSTGDLRGVPTGFPALDTLLAGLQKSDLIILAARPSMGKTAFALDIARQTAVQHNTPVGIFSLEMSSQQLVDRMLAAESRVNAWELRTGKLKNEEDFNRIRDGLDRLSKAPIFIDDKPAANILKMRSVARRLKREHGIGLLIVDYLQLMSPTNTKSSDSMVQQITEISRSLKILARELNIPVLALSQLSRAIEQRRGKPRLSDLRDSGSIEQDADVVMFIHREDKMNPGAERNNICEIMVEKHRNGPVGSIELYFDDKKTTFMSIEKSDFGEFSQPSTITPDDF